MPAYAELAVTTNFSFLRGASHPQEYVAQAAALGLDGHRHRRPQHACRRGAGLCGGEEAARQPKLLVGARLVTTDGFEAIAYPIDRDAYGRLCQLLSTRQPAGQEGRVPISASRRSLAASDGQILIAMPPPRLTKALRRAVCRSSRDAAPGSDLPRGGPSLPRRRAAPPRPPRRVRRAPRRAAGRRRTTRSTTRPSAARCRTCSPASARNARFARPASGWKPTPSGISRAPEEMAPPLRGLSRGDRAHGGDRGCLQLLARAS